MGSVTSTDVLRRRLYAQRLLGVPLGASEDVVRWFGAVQAQDFAPAKWAVGRRTSGATDADLDAAYADGAILRTHVLRPTWHFATPADLRMLLAATAPRVQSRTAHRYRQLGLDAAALQRGEAVLSTALEGGGALTRAELGERFTAAGLAVEGQRLPYLLMHAELEGLVCSGPPRGAQHTYALLDERVPPSRSMGRDEALAELALRYFTSHGPATAKDFAGWASLTLAEVRGVLEAVGSRVCRETIDGSSFWSATVPAVPRPVPLGPASPAVHLIHGYDEYVMGYSESKHLLARPGGSWTPATPPVYALVVLLDGYVAGFWRPKVSKSSVILEVALLEPFDGDQTRALEAEAASYGRFRGDRQVELVVAARS